ncbi:hypothetical protein EJB05_17221, partial [Eragrostis curvula]
GPFVSAPAGNPEGETPCQPAPPSLVLPPRARAVGRAPARISASPPSHPATGTCTRFRARTPLVTPRPRLRVSARPAHPAIKARARPTLDDADAAAVCLAPPPYQHLRLLRPPLDRSTDMAGVSKPPVSNSSSSSGGDNGPRRITRKRRSARRVPRGGATRRPSAPRPLNELDLNTAAFDPEQYAARLRVILQKELRNSDVSQLGRIVLPKKEAEAYLPNLISKDGKFLCMLDLVLPIHDSDRVRHISCRYWPNNKSRMYVLENTGDYVRARDLQQGDFIVIYKDDENNRFVIGAKKAGDGQTATVPQLHEHVSATSPPPSQVIHDYAAPVAPEAGILAFMPQADENYEIFDGILNSLPEIPVANVRYSDFFDPFGDCMDMANPLNASHSVNLATHFHDGSSSLLPNPKSGPLL